MYKDDLTGIHPGAKGCYIFILRLEENRVIRVGSFGERPFQAGWYAYVGSALGGLKGRLSRHLRQEKKLRWHIDYLLQAAPVQDIIIVETPERVECSLAAIVGELFPVIPKFGSSDCRCGGHLFYSEQRPSGELLRQVKEAGYTTVPVKRIREA